MLTLSYTRSGWAVPNRVYDVYFVDEHNRGVLIFAFSRDQTMGAHWWQSQEGATQQVKEQYRSMLADLRDIAREYARAETGWRFLVRPPHVHGGRYGESDVRGGGGDTHHLQKGTEMRDYIIRRVRAPEGEKAAVDAGESLQEEVCSICRSSLMDGHLTMMRCGHTFHTVCINRWKAGGHSVCPECRERMVTRVSGAPLLMF